MLGDSLFMHVHTYIDALRHPVFVPLQPLFTQVFHVLRHVSARNYAALVNRGWTIVIARRCSTTTDTSKAQLRKYINKYIQWLLLFHT